MFILFTFFGWYDGFKWLYFLLNLVDGLYVYIYGFFFFLILLNDMVHVYFLFWFDGLYESF